MYIEWLAAFNSTLKIEHIVDTLFCGMAYQVHKNVSSSSDFVIRTLTETDVNLSGDFVHHSAHLFLRTPLKVHSKLFHSSWFNEWPSVGTNCKAVASRVPLPQSRTTNYLSVCTNFVNGVAQYSFWKKKKTDDPNGKVPDTHFLRAPSSVCVYAIIAIV